MMVNVNPAQTGRVPRLRLLSQKILWNQYAAGKRCKSCEELPTRGSEG
jgi:hypothetical protein